MYENIKIVELVGLPGVGKTTVTKLIKSACKDSKILYNENLKANLIFNGKFELFYWFVINICRNPKVYKILFLSLKLHNFSQIRYKLRRLSYLIIKLSALEKVNNRNKGYLVILDQGYFQWLWSYLEYVNLINSLKYINEYNLLNIRLSNKYIHLFVNADENIKRLLEREKDCVFKKCTINELYILIIKGDKFFNLILSMSEYDILKFKSTDYTNKEINQLVTFIK